jgi:hypothetical protein
MTRLRNGFVAFVLVGGLASLSILGDEIGAVIFFWGFFGGIAGVVAMLATGGRVKPELDDDEVVNFGQARRNDYESPFKDKHGVVRYFGDPLDIENFPEPGACGRIREWH